VTVDRMWVGSDGVRCTDLESYFSHRYSAGSLIIYLLISPFHITSGRFSLSLNFTLASVAFVEETALDQIDIVVVFKFRTQDGCW